MSASSIPPDVRAELGKVRGTLLELRERRVALTLQCGRMFDASRKLEAHRLSGQGAHAPFGSRPRWPGQGPKKP